MDNNSIKVLLIEDNPGHAHLIREILSKVRGSSFYMDWADCLQTGLDRLAQGGTDLVLLDLSLPDSLGLETFIRVQTQTPRLPIVVLSGIDDEAIAFEAVRQGAQDYLIKGQMDINLLVRAMRYAIERKRIEEELRLSENKYRSIFEGSRDAIYIISKDSKFIDVNQAAVNLFGYKKEEMIGLDVKEIYANRSDWQRFKQEIEQNGSVRDYDSKLRKKDGTEMDCLITSTLRWDNNGSILGYQGIIRDITEKKLMEEQLRWSQKMKAVGTLAAGIAHEIGNPLTSISSLMQLLQKKSNDAFVKNNLLLMGKHIDRINKIVRNMVDFARPVSDEWKLVEINDVVNSAVDISKYDKRAKNIEVITNLNENLRKCFLVEDQLLQVFTNIILNAFDAMPDGGQLIINTEEKLDGVYISFTDTGEGISKDVAKHIFDPFFTTKEVGRGAGLGLSVSYGIIKNFGGDIELQSTEGSGSTFAVILPIREIKENGRTDIGSR